MYVVFTPSLRCVPASAYVDELWLIVGNAHVERDPPTEQAHAFDWRDLWKTKDQQAAEAFANEDHELAAALFESVDSSQICFGIISDGMQKSKSHKTFKIK